VDSKERLALDPDLWEKDEANRQRCSVLEGNHPLESSGVKSREKKKRIIFLLETLFLQSTLEKQEAL
jgi:hypothetical protein